MENIGVDEDPDIDNLRAAIVKKSEEKNNTGSFQGSSGNPYTSPPEKSGKEDQPSESEDESADFYQNDDLKSSQMIDK